MPLVGVGVSILDEGSNPRIFLLGVIHVDRLDGVENGDAEVFL